MLQVLKQCFDKHVAHANYLSSNNNESQLIGVEQKINIDKSRTEITFSKIISSAKCPNCYLLDILLHFCRNFGSYSYIKCNISEFSQAKFLNGSYYKVKKLIQGRYSPNYDFSTKKLSQFIVFLIQMQSRMEGHKKHGIKYLAWMWQFLASCLTGLKFYRDKTIQTIINQDIKNYKTST